MLSFSFAIIPGTSPENVDVRDYVTAGVSNMAVATGLTLEGGHTYYVTVRGEYFRSYHMNS